MKPLRRPSRWWKRQNALAKTLCALGLLLAAFACIVVVMLTVQHYNPSLFPTASNRVQNAQVSTPTAPWTILPQAASLCEAALTQPVSQGSPRSYLLYLQKTDYEQEGWVGLDDKGLLGRPYEAQTPDEVGTLVCVKKTRARVATYGGSIPGYRVDWEVRLVSWPGGTVLASESYPGDKLPDTILVYGQDTAEGVYYGDEPSFRAVSEWLVAAVLNDTALHLEDDMKSLAFSPSGTLLAAGGWHGRVRVWEVASIQEAASWMEVVTFDALEHVEHVVFSPDGRFLATSDYKETKLWDVATWQAVRTVDGGGTTCFSPDGRWLAASRSEGGADTTTLWDVGTGQRARSFEGSVGAFLPGQMLLTTYREAGVTVWDATTGQEVRFYPRLGRHFSADGQLSASRGQNGQPILFDMETGEEVHALGNPGNDVMCLAFSPDGALLASGRRMEASVSLWDVSTGQKANVLRWHWSHVLAMAFSPDGELLATGDEYGTIKLWDTGTWR